ncbi:MAG TPA: hypothetical protein VD866_02730 [Urbifossiella sp.]|nr:hypothetical protein [Urbifossiella sp.]
MNATPPAVMMLNLHLCQSNADLLDEMRLMKAAREAGTVSNIVAMIDGFDDDERELEQIVEVRAFARRLLTIGFAAYLDLIPSANPQLNGTLGCAELAWIEEGVPPPPAGPITEVATRMVNAAVLRTRAAATAALGPFTPRGTRA